MIRWLVGLLLRSCLGLMNFLLSLRQPELARFMSSDDRAERAYRKGNWAEAETLAQEGLELAEHYSQEWNYGNVIHNCHQVLGLLSLRERNLPEAKKHLLAAGKTPGSPQLDSFGPRMILARELVLRGEYPVVLQYLDMIAKFWANEKKSRFAQLTYQHQLLLNRWKVEIAAGRIPTYRNWAGDI